MTSKQKAYRKGLLRSIHTTLVYRNTFADDREAWVELLQSHYRVSSSAKLSIADLVSLLAYLQGRSTTPAVTTASEAQIGFIISQWEQRSIYKDTYSLLRFATRTLQRDVDDLATLTRAEASRLIAATKKLKPRLPANDPTYSRR